MRLLLLAFACLLSCRSAHVDAPPFRPGMAENRASGKENAASCADSLFSASPSEKETERSSTPRRADFAPTPAGERRYIRALRAATPRTLGPGAVYAPNNRAPITTTVATGKKAQALKADSGATVNQQIKPAGPTATGAGATASQVKPPLLPTLPWALIGGIGGLCLLLFLVHRHQNRQA